MNYWKFPTKWLKRGLQVGLAAITSLAMHSALAGYNIGVGKDDVTAVDLGNVGEGWAGMGLPYKGLALRNFARAFVIQDDVTQREFAFVVLEYGNTNEWMRPVLLQRLNAIMPGRFTEDNLALLVTHTHGTPGVAGGTHDKLLKTIVDGTVSAIVAAVKDKAPGEIKYAYGETNIAEGSQRAHKAFDLNKPEDKALFPKKKDPVMNQLLFERNGQAIGSLSFYGLHPGSMMDEGLYFVSSDNYGYAARKLEDDINRSRPPGSKPFVAALAQTGTGDQSANINYARCDDTKWAGPLSPNPLARHDWGCKRGASDIDAFESTRILGEQLAAAAANLMQKSAAASPIDQGVVRNQRLNYRYEARNIENLDVLPKYTQEATIQKTCKPAWGFAFMAGSDEDIASVFGRDVNWNQFQLAYLAGWAANQPWAAAVVKLFGFNDFNTQNVTPEMKACQGSKNVLAAPASKPTGLQVLKLGNVVFGFTPFETTTVANYRIRRDLANDMQMANNRQVVIASYASTIAPSLNATTAGYMVTPAEYEAKEYESGTTSFGKWTQPAISQFMGELGKQLMDNNSRPAVPSQTPVPNTFGPLLAMSNQPLDRFTAPTGWDGGPWFSTPGKVLEQPRMVQRQDFNGKVVIGDKRRFIQTKFVSGHPMHRPQQTTAAMPENTFFFIKKLNANGRWETVDRDGRWRSTIEWNDVPLCINCRSATVMWQIPDDAEGTYQVVHQGWWKPFWFSNELQTFSQASESFRIAKNQ